MENFLELNKEIHIDGLHSFFYSEHSKDFYYVGEKHDTWELVYVDSGEIHAVADNNQYVLSQGNVIFHKPMEFHGMTAVNGKPHNVLVSAFMCSSPAMEFFSEKIFDLNIKQKKILSSFLDEARSVLGNRFDAHSNSISFSEEQKLTYQIAVGILERFLLELMREGISVSNAEKEDNIAKKNVENALVYSIKIYIEKNIYNSITLDDICKHFNMSKSYICQIFKDETGSSVIDYYITKKITKAKFMIRQGNLNFTQIAERLGYKSLQHFTRSFKSKEKMSPGQYEKSIK